jgi:hypothetical protein
MTASKFDLQQDFTSFVARNENPAMPQARLMSTFVSTIIALKNTRAGIGAYLHTALLGLGGSRQL